jgi:hypothetical protein
MVKQSKLPVYKIDPVMKIVKKDKPAMVYGYWMVLNNTVGNTYMNPF